MVLNLPIRAQFPFPRCCYRESNFPLLLLLHLHHAHFHQGNKDNSDSSHLSPLGISSFQSSIRAHYPRGWTDSNSKEKKKRKKGVKSLFCNFRWVLSWARGGHSNFQLFLLNGMGCNFENEADVLLKKAAFWHFPVPAIGSASSAGSCCFWRVCKIWEFKGKALSCFCFWSEPSLQIKWNRFCKCCVWWSEEESLHRPKSSPQLKITVTQ